MSRDIASLCLAGVMMLAACSPAETENPAAATTAATATTTALPATSTTALPPTSTTAAPATTTTTTTTTRPPVVCWDGSTARLRGLCPAEPRWVVSSWVDAFGGEIERAELLSDDGDAVMYLRCAEDVLSVFVLDADERTDPAALRRGLYWRPDGLGDSGGRYRGDGQNSAVSVSWQALVDMSRELTVRGVFLPKTYRRGWVDTLRSSNEVVIDWFYGTDTFEWPEGDSDYEGPLETCDW